MVTKTNGVSYRRLILILYNKRRAGNFLFKSYIKNDCIFTSIFFFKLEIIFRQSKINISSVLDRAYFSSVLDRAYFSSVLDRPISVVY